MLKEMFSIGSIRREEKGDRELGESAKGHRSWAFVEMAKLRVPTTCTGADPGTLTICVE